jgi:cytochrome c553
MMQSVRVLAFTALASIFAAEQARPENRQGDRLLGEYLSAECVTCHQVTGKVTGAIPPIIAWPDEQFIAVMHSYKNKERENSVMQTMAGRLSDDEIAALAAYFGNLPHQPYRN